MSGSRPKFDILKLKKKKKESIDNEFPSTIIYLKLVKIQGIVYTKVLQIKCILLEKSILFRFFKFDSLKRVLKVAL